MALGVLILGSGVIVPTAGRRSTALLVEADGERILVDCGPGTPDALAEAGVSFRDLGCVLLTHLHPDHTLGIGHLLSAINVDELSRGRDSLLLAGPPGLRRFIEGWHALYELTIPRWPYLRIVEVEGGSVPVGDGWSVTAAPASHGEHPALAYRIERNGGSIAFTGDTGYSERVAELARGADILVAECSFPDDRPAAGHLTPRECARLASAAGAGRLVLVHLYPVFGAGDAAACARQGFRGPVSVAYDGLEIEIP